MNLRRTCALLLASALPVVMAGCKSHTSFDDGVTAVKGDSGEVNITKMGGGIDVGEAPHGANLTTMGGGIHLGNVAVFARVKTMGGGIKVREVGSLSQERDIELTSKSGTIELTVPKDFPMDVRIILAYTRTDRDYRIVQDAGLEVRETNVWDTSEGTPRKYIRAAGRVGSGLNLVTIKTINGDVILRQE